MGSRTERESQDVACTRIQACPPPTPKKKRASLFMRAQEESGESNNEDILKHTSTGTRERKKSDAGAKQAMESNTLAEKRTHTNNKSTRVCVCADVHV